VTDPDLNTNAATKQVYSSQVSATAQFWSHATDELVTSNKMFIPIAETGLDTGVFTGEMSTLTSAQSGSLQIFDEDDTRKASTVVTMVYESAKSEFPIATTRLMTDASATIEARNPRPVSVYLVSSTWEIRNPIPETRNPIPETRNQTSETRNQKPEIRHPKPETKNLKSEPRNPEPESRCRIPNPQPHLLTPKPFVRRWTARRPSRWGRTC